MPSMMTAVSPNTLKNRSLFWVLKPSMWVSISDWSSAGGVFATFIAPFIWRSPGSSRTVSGLERHHSRDLQRVTLKRRPVGKLLEVLQAQAHLARRQGHIRREPQRIHSVMGRGLFRGNRRSGFVGRLPLAIADQAKLQLRVSPYPHGVRERVVDIGGLPRMNISPVLDRMELVHVKRRQRGRFGIV